MFENVGTANSAGIAVAMIVVAALVPIIFIQWKGPNVRGRMVTMI